MPIYMDVHNVPGVKAMKVAEAHRLDLLHQEEYGCNCMTYWIDEGRESIFCLIEAPTKEAVEELHSKAHGLVPHKVIEVSSTVVESFLGRIYDPPDAETNPDGLKVFSDPSFRIILVTTITDPVLLKHKWGAERAGELLERHNQLIRKCINQYGGSEVEHGGSGFIISFGSASKAVSCALAIAKGLEADAQAMGLKLGINAGEPVEKSNKLFGDTIQLAQYLCAVAKDHQVAISAAVKELVAKDYFQNNHHPFRAMSPQDEALLSTLFDTLGQNWQDPDFDLDLYCQSTAMSKSQLYRKTIALTGFSPNALLKEYRLERARELMKKKHYNISQITFDSGFTSPSYFTKCFKGKFGLLPMSYVDLVR